MSHCKCHASSSYVPAGNVQIGGSVQLESLFNWVASVEERLFNVNKTIFKLKRASEDKRSWTSNGWQSSIICQWRRKEILRLRTVKDIKKKKLKICSRSVCDRSRIPSLTFWGCSILSGKFLQGVIFDRRKIQQDFPGEDIEICIDVILRSIPREAFSYLAAGDIDGDIGARFKRGRWWRKTLKLFLTMIRSVMRLNVTWKWGSGLVLIGNIFDSFAVCGSWLSRRWSKAWLLQFIGCIAWVKWVISSFMLDVFKLCACRKWHQICE